MIKKQLLFSTEGNPLPLSLNTFHDPAQLLDNEVVINQAVIRLPNGELSAHPKWKNIPVNGCTRLISGIWVDTVFMEPQFIVFGHDTGVADDIGFIGRILASDIAVGGVTIEKIVTNLNQNIVPDFAIYNRGVYFAMGSTKLRFYNGVTVEDAGGELETLVAGCLYVLRGRLWCGALLADPGLVKFTEIGTEEIKATNNLACGDAGKLVTSLDSDGASMIVYKGDEVYQFRWADNIAEGTLDTKSAKAGCAYHTLNKRKFDFAHFVDTNGAYMLNPRYVKASGRDVIVDPEVIEISRPIKNLVDNYSKPNIFSKLYYDETFDYAQANNVTQGDTVILAKTAPAQNQWQNGVSTGWTLQWPESASQSFKPTIDFELYSLYFKLRITNQDEIKADLVVELCADNENAPGEIIDYKKIPKEFITYNFNPSWYSVLVPFEGGEAIELEADIRYWIKLHWDTDPENEGVEWCWMGGDPYSRGDFWVSGLPGIISGFDATFKVFERHYPDSGYIISDDISLAGISNWLTIGVTETKPEDTSITYQVRAKDGPWYAISPGGIWPEEIKTADIINYKATLATTKTSRTPTLDTLKISGLCIGDGKPMVAGYREDRYYIFGVDASDTKIYLGYNREDGWHTIDETDDAYTYGEIWEDIEVNNLRIIGLGRLDGLDKGCLFYAVDPDDDDYYNTTTQLKTGKLLMSDIDKKGRRIFIIYKGTEINLKLYTDNDELLFELDDADDFVIRELNFGTARTRWFVLELNCEAKLGLKKLQLEYKEHKPNED